MNVHISYTIQLDEWQVKRIVEMAKDSGYGYHREGTKPPTRKQLIKRYLKERGVEFIDYLGDPH